MDKKTKKKFEDLAKAQRGNPEQAMIDIQRSGISNFYGFLAEHIGDLTHRMSENINSMEGGYAYVEEKVDKALRSLTQGYGFEREVKEEIENNLDFLKRKGNVDEDLTYEDMLEKLKELGEKYAEAHENLPTFNKVQKIAQQAAIAYGNWDFNRCVKKLKILKRHLNEGIDHWKELAKETEYDFRSFSVLSNIKYVYAEVNDNELKKIVNLLQDKLKTNYSEREHMKKPVGVVFRIASEKEFENVMSGYLSGSFWSSDPLEYMEYLKEGKYLFIANPQGPKKYKGLDGEHYHNLEKRELDEILAIYAVHGRSISRKLIKIYP